MSIFKDAVISPSYNGNTITYLGYTYSWEDGRQLKSITGNGQGDIIGLFDKTGTKVVS